MIPEKHTQDDIVRLFQSMGLYVQRVNSGNVQNMATGSWLKLADKGHSDLVACDKNNAICFIECKSETGRLSDDQIYFLREQNNKNRRWLVAVSVNDAVAFLNDEFYHGQQKHVDAVLDESRWVTAPHRKNAKMNASTLNAWNRHMDARESR